MKPESGCWPTTCRYCGCDVFFVRHNGGAVFFDSLGEGWPKHECQGFQPPNCSDARPFAGIKNWAIALGVEVTRRGDSIVRVVLLEQLTPDRPRQVFSIPLSSACRAGDMLGLVRTTFGAQLEMRAGQRITGAAINPDQLPKESAIRKLAKQHTRPLPEVESGAEGVLRRRRELQDFLAAFSKAFGRKWGFWRHGRACFDSILEWDQAGRPGKCFVLFESRVPPDTPCSFICRGLYYLRTGQDERVPLIDRIFVHTGPMHRLGMESARRGKHGRRSKKR